MPGGRVDHGIGLSLDAGGFVPLRAVVEALRARGIADATEDRLRRVVAAQRDKRRLEIEGVRIRAAYGHSVAAVDASAYERRRPPPLLFHGTARGRVGAILREGLAASPACPTGPIRGARTSPGSGTRRS